jgi:two-component system cell cycle sensor histidine kinase/response regulator CckA
MGGWTSAKCQELVQALSIPDEVEAWNRVVALLDEWGLQQCAFEASGSDRDVCVLVDERQERFIPSAEFPLEGLAFARESLTVALRRIVEQERRELAEERSEMLSFASFEGLLVHVDGDVIDVNDRLVEMLGWDKAELLGPGTVSLCVDPQDIGNVFARMQSGYEGSYVITGQRRDGSKFRAELQSKQGRLGDRPVRIAAVRDVTQREHTLTLLRESEKRLQELANTVFDLTVLSREGIVLAAEGPLIERCGYNSQELINKSVLELSAPSAVALVSERIGKGLSGAYRANMVDAQGDPFPVEIVAVESTLNGLPTRVSGVRDLREAHKLEEERSQLQRRVEQAQRLDSLGVLAGGIAHDFNNLMMSVLGNAENLLFDAQESGAEKEQISMLEGILEATGRATDLTQRLLAYAGRGRIGPPEPLNVGELLEELRRAVESRRQPKATLKTEIEESCVVMGDRTTLTQVLLNLLTNAAEATLNQGEIAVRVHRTENPDNRWDNAYGATVGPGNWVLIEVIDTGEGMQEHTLQRIFEPFFSTKSRGSGLGLAACLGIVNTHGGALHVTSEPSIGTRFSLLLPAHQAQEEARPISSSRNVPIGRRRVLVVDDEPTVRAQVMRSLLLRGVNVTEAQSGPDCLSKMKGQQFDVIVLDISMPEMDGTEVVGALRKRGDNTPIVLMSGYMSPAQEKRLQVGSFQAFIPKPFGIGELICAIEQALGSSVSLPPEPAAS